MKPAGGVLEAGLHTVVKSSLQNFPSYEEEARDIQEQKPSSSLRLVNQEKTLREMARVLSTAYPYAVLVGDPGIGKSLSLTTFSRLLTDELQVTELPSSLEDIIPLVEQIKEKSTIFQTRDYLLLPNLKDPNLVEAISYTDKEQFQTDTGIAESFCNQLTEFLSGYAYRSKGKIGLGFSSKDEFEIYLRSAIHNLFVDLYAYFKESLDEVYEESFETRLPIMYFSMEPPATPKKLKPEGEFRFINDSGVKIPLANYTLKSLAGYAVYKKGTRRQDMERDIFATFLTPCVKTELKPLLGEVLHARVAGQKSEDNFALFQDVFQTYVDEVIKPLPELYRDGTINNATALFDHLSVHVSEHQTTYTVNDGTIDDIVEKLGRFRKRIPSEASPQLQERLRGWIDYFCEERGMLKNALREVLGSMYQEELESDPVQAKKRRKQEKNLTARQRLQKHARDFPLKIPHGRYVMKLEDILKVRPFESPMEPNVRLAVKLTDMTEERVYGDFSAPTEHVPPHLSCTRLGTLNEGHIVLVEDAFDDFLRMFLGGDGEKSKKDFLLQYLQSGTFSVMRDGITYKFYMPRIVIGCSNDDPFLVSDGFDVRDEKGLRGRISLLPVPSFTANTRQARKGSFEVMYRTIEEYKARNKVDDLELTPEAANLFLIDTLVSDKLLHLSYRELEQTVDEACAYAIAHGEKAITPALLKRLNGEQIPDGFFLHIDSEKDAGGFFDQPDAQPGQVNGLAVFGSGQGAIVRVQSYFVPGIDRQRHGSRFDLVDMSSELTDETTCKGYTLADDYLNILLEKMGINDVLQKGNWKVRTQFDKNWSGIGGPSASLGIGVSILSALAGQPVYRNRFVTGTLNAFDGSVGEIGGLYHKSLVPTHLADITSHSNETFYLLYPIGNHREFQKDLLFDPVGVDQKITAIGVSHFAEAFYLMTCNKTISSEDFKHAQRLGEEKITSSLSKIKKRFEKLYDSPKS